MTTPTETPERAAPHQRNLRLEEILGHLNTDLGLIDDSALAGHTSPTKPTIFLVGCARSGTTLALQWLNHLGHFCAPTNFVSRFYAAPWVGERVQQMLTNPDCDFRGELTLDTAVDPAPFTSQLGKTRGLLAPNEFWYWWRRFLPEAPTHCLSAAQLAGVDDRRLCAELAAWQSVTNRPLVMKALIMNWNLPWLAAAVPGSVFVHITRDRIMNSQSLLEARRSHLGDVESWYSFRPAEYEQLKDLPAPEQVAGQIHHTEAAISAGLADIAPDRQLHLTYEKLCQSPKEVYQDLQRLLAARDCTVSEVYEGPKFFPVSKKIRLDEVELMALREAWRAYRTT